MDFHYHMQAPFSSRSSSGSSSSSSGTQSQQQQHQQKQNLGQQQEREDFGQEEYQQTHRSSLQSLKTRSQSQSQAQQTQTQTHPQARASTPPTTQDSSFSQRSSTTTKKSFFASAIPSRITLPSLSTFTSLPYSSSLPPPSPVHPQITPSNDNPLDLYRTSNRSSASPVAAFSAPASAYGPPNHDNSQTTLSSMSQTPSITQLPPIHTMMVDHQHQQYQQQQQWPSLNNTQQYRAPSSGANTQSMDSPSTVDFETASNGTYAPSPDPRLDRRSASVTLDDLDVRMAAEALGDLKTNFVSSPPNLNAHLSLSPPVPHRRSQSSQEPEPLLSLLTTAHPFLASTIGNASSAYGGAKNFSPRFKSGAEYVEGYLTPLANTVGSVSGRVPGVDRSVRWFLGAGRRERSEADVTVEGSKKRRKVQNGSEPSEPSNKRRESDSVAPTPSDVDAMTDSMSSTPLDSRRMSFSSSVCTLPGYTDLAEGYNGTSDPQSADAKAQSSETPESQRSSDDSRSHANAPWASRLIISTSGLGCAMNDDSLRRLKWTLEVARRANHTLGVVPDKIKTLLEQFENPKNDNTIQADTAEKDGSQVTVEPIDDAQIPEEARQELAKNINTLRDEIARTLGTTIQNVSRYASGALPENARNLVYRHLVSLPQRFAFANRSQASNESQTNNSNNNNANSDSALRERARQVLVLAKEGLDMVSQVSGVIDATIVSAEEWCERMGKKRKDGHDQMNQGQGQGQNESGDVKMTQ